MGNVHHLTSFGFIAFPDRFKASGSRLFILNESGTMFSCDPGRSGSP